MVRGHPKKNEKCIWALEKQEHMYPGVSACIQILSCKEFPMDSLSLHQLSSLSLCLDQLKTTQAMIDCPYLLVETSPIGSVSTNLIAKRFSPLPSITAGRTRQAESCEIQYPET